MTIYKVRCARTTQDSIYRGRTIPINGKSHADPDLGIEWEHFHIDWRYLTRDDMDAFVLRSGLESIEQHYFVVVNISDIVGFEYKSFASRNDLAFEAYKVFSPWLILLEKKYQGVVCKGKKCPHRGADLSGCIPNEAGLITCPYHGLMVDQETMTVYTQFLHSKVELQVYYSGLHEVDANRRHGKKAKRKQDEENKLRTTNL